MWRRFISLVFLAAAVLVATGTHMSAMAARELDFWVYGSEKNDQVEKIAAAFSAKSGVKVNVIVVPKNDFNTKINAAIASGAAPDLSFLDQPLVPRFAVDGLLLQLDEYMKADKLSKDEFFPGAYNTNLVQGKLYGLPLNMTCVALYYNKDLVKNPPKTWDEWLAMAKKVYRPGKIAAFEGIWDGGWGAWLFPAFVHAAGGTMMSPDGKRITFNEAPAVEALRFIQEMRKYSDLAVISSDKAFENGRVATKISGPWEISGYRTNFPNLRYGVALVPKKKVHASNIGGENLVIYKTTKDPKAAWDFLKFLSTPENNLIMADVTGNFPVSVKAAKNKKFQTDPDYRVFMEQLKYAQARPTVTQWLKINDEAIGKALAMANEGMDPKQALDQAAKMAAEMLKQ
ncbi:MAG: ABC transporter substrate-binding protein [Bacteroidota bacterium]